MIDTYCDPEWVCHPAVCAVGTNYHIILPVKSDMILWVVIGSQKFYDESNGVLRSAFRVHRVIVPMNVLDAAESYTVVYRKSIDRKPYFPKMGEPVAHEYSFRPVKKRENIHIYQLADTHGIPTQTKTRIAGGTDAASIQRSLSGVRVAAISLPCRYIHTASCVADVSDMAACVALGIALAKT